MAGGPGDVAFIAALLWDPSGASDLDDPGLQLDPGPGGLRSLAGRGLELLLQGDVAIVHVDAGGRTLELPGTPISVVKLGVYTIPPRGHGEPRLQVPLYRLTGGKALSAIYARADYRLRQALAFLVESAGLLAASRRARDETGASHVIALKDGPLIQHIAPYTRPSVSVSREEALASLLYAGLEVEDAYRITADAVGDDGRVNVGALVIRVLEEIKGEVEGGWLHPMGVVEDTSRSRSLLTYLAARAIAHALAMAYKASPNQPPDMLVERAVDELLRAAEEGVQALSRSGGDIRECLGVSRAELHQGLADLGGDARGLLDRLIGMLNRTGYSIAGIALSLKSSEERALEVVADALISGQMLPGHIRDPDLVMFSYYMGILRTLTTRQYKRLDLVSSMSKIAGESDGASRVREKALGLARSLLYRYLITDPPPTCRGLRESLRRRGLGGLTPYELARSDSYAYAPPVRLESFAGDGMERDALAVAALESYVARYKYPQGLLLADKASRVTVEEAYAARSLAERLVPLRYYIRSWERRIELG